VGALLSAGIVSHYHAVRMYECSGSDTRVRLAVRGTYRHRCEVGSTREESLVTREETSGRLAVIGVSM